MADVVVGDNNLNKPSRFSFIKKNKWQLFVILIFIIIAVATFFVFFNKNDSKYSVGQGRINTKSYNSKQKELKDQLKIGATDQEKTDIYFKLMSEALQNNNITDATVYANDIKNVSGKSDTFYASMAYISEAKNDKAQAIQYWQKAIDVLDPNIEGYNLIKNDYQISINELK